MPSDIFSSIGAQNAPQSPRDQAMNLLQQYGISVPREIANNPQAIIQHLMQSGVVPQGRLGMAQQMISRMFRR